MSYFAYPKLSAAVMALSRNKDKEVKAYAEWEQVDEITGGNCICGRKDIRGSVYIMENRYNKKRITVGNECINRFESDEIRRAANENGYESDSDYSPSDDDENERNIIDLSSDEETDHSSDEDEVESKYQDNLPMEDVDEEKNDYRIKIIHESARQFLIARSISFHNTINEIREYEQQGYILEKIIKEKGNYKAYWGDSWIDKHLIKQ